MPTLLKSIPLMALVALAAPATAQDDAATSGDAPATQTSPEDAAPTGGDAAAGPQSPDVEADAAPEADAPEDAATEADAATDGDADAPDAIEGATPGLSMGQEVDGDPRAGETYTADTFEDWQQRCIRTEDGNDPCQLYQLLEDGNGNAVAEITVVALPEGGQAAAGATIITPLETLLTEQLTLAVDSAQPKRYPFNFCAEAGCFSRIGLTAAEVEAMRRGSRATLTIVPAAAPDQTIELAVSLAGFTAGYEAVREANAE